MARPARSALSEVLRHERGEPKESQAEYQRTLESVHNLLSADWLSVLEAAIDKRRRESALAGTVDPKVVELDLLREREHAVMQAGRKIVDCKKAEDMKLLFGWLRNLFLVFPKARMAKIVRILIEMLPSEWGDLQVELCLQCIEWCRDEKRTFLRHRLETKLCSLYEGMGRYKDGLEMINVLLKEVRKLDDKILLVEIYLVECRLYFSIRNHSKAKTSLTSAKTNGNAIHCPPMLQAEIDLLDGCLHAEEHDYHTAYSYFYEAFETFDTSNDMPKATQALKYMILCNILTGFDTNDLAPIRQSHSGTTNLKYEEHSDIIFLRKLGETHKTRNLDAFRNLVIENQQQIQGDSMIARHIGEAAERLLQQSIFKIVMPYSSVYIQHIASKTNLSCAQVEQKLAEMILDKKLQGSLDQKKGVFTLYEEPKPSALYEDAICTFETLTDIVELLSKKVATVF